MHDLRTEMPDDWDEMKLNSVIQDLSAGISVNSDDRPAGRNEVGVLKTSSLNKGRFVFTENKVITQKEEIERAKKTPKLGTILVSRMNTAELVGEIAYVDKDYINLYLPDRIWITEGVNTDDVNAKWLSYKLTSPEVRHNIKRIATGTSGSMKNITQKDFLKLPIAFPSKQEQNKIVNILETWDEAISKTEKLIKAKQRYKKGLMQRLLSGKVQLPEFAGEEWIEVKLKKFFRSFSVKNKDNEDLPILSCSKVHGITLQSNIFDKRIASKDIKRYKIVDKDDLIYDPMLLWDASIGFLKEVGRGVISPAYNTFKFNANSGYRPFFEYLFDTHYMRHNYKSISQGTNRRRRKAPAEAFLGIDIKVPKSIEEQRRIGTFLDTLTRDIELLKQEITLYHKQKKGLMQQLLTGKVRVNQMN